eukprot:scaffold2229_cov413-Prasinococcus_capsulatus_cf.AAC.7
MDRIAGKHNRYSFRTLGIHAKHDQSSDSEYTTTLARPRSPLQYHSAIKPKLLSQVGDAAICNQLGIKRQVGVCVEVLAPRRRVAILSP